MMTNDGEYRNLERVLEETKDELQRERKLHQLDNQERAKLKVGRIFHDSDFWHTYILIDRVSY